MEYYTVLPKWKYSSKEIEIFDADRMQIGFIQRKYKGFWSKIIHYSPLRLSFMETIHIDAESNGNKLKIREQSFKSNLTKLK